MKIPIETIERTIKQSFSDKSTEITPETLLGIQRYFEVFVEEAVLRCQENNEIKDGRIELTHTQLEEIIGLLLMDM